MAKNCRKDRSERPAEESKEKRGLFGKSKKGGDEPAPAPEEPKEKRGLFGRSKKGAEPEAQEDMPAAPVKPSESLGSVLSESVPSATLGMIQKNDPFCYPVGAKKGQSCYVVLKLDVRDVGGLNAHMKRDPDKGQFIEYVNRGSVEVFVPEEGLKLGYLYIIPSALTCQNLMEFEFLANPQKFSRFLVTLVHVDGNGEMEFEPLKNAYVDFQWVRDTVAGRVKIAEAVRRAQEAAASMTHDEEAAIEADRASEEARVETAGEVSRILDGDGEDDGDDPFAQSEPDVSAPPEDNFSSSFISGFTAPAQEPVQESEPEPAPVAPQPAPVTQDAGYAPLPESADAGFGTSQPAPQPVAQPVQQQAPLPEYSGTPYGAQQSQQQSGPDYIDPNMGAYGVSQVPCPSCGNMMNPGEPCEFCGYMPPVSGMSQEDLMDQNDEDDEVTDEEVQEACERLFHAGGLDLQITAQPFDIQFMQANPFVPISEKRGDGWLNGYVTQMVKNANSELRRMHKQNLFKARNQFLALMTEACDEIASSVDMDSPDTPYYKVRQELSNQASARRAGIEEEVSRRRTDMQREWDDELKQIMDSAAQAARRSYMEKHSADHEAKLRDVEISLLDNIEIDYQRDMSDLNDRRRTEAKRKLDLHVSQTLLVMGDAYQAMLEEEDKARQEFLDSIQEYIDTHRKEETARMEVLAEGQRQKEEAEKVAADYERRLKTIAAEHDATCDKYLQEIAAARAHEESVKKEYAARYEEFAAREKESDERYETLLDRFQTLDAAKSAEYEARLTALRNDKAAAEEHLAHVDLVHNKYNKVSLAVWGAIAVATFCTGLLIGSLFINRTPAVPDGHYSISFTAPTNSESQNGTESENGTEVGPEAGDAQEDGASDGE